VGPLEFAGKTFAVILPDEGECHLASALFADVINPARP